MMAFRRVLALALFVEVVRGCGTGFLAETWVGVFARLVGVMMSVGLAYRGSLVPGEFERDDGGVGELVGLLRFG
jgi:hypothetical protein